MSAKADRMGLGAVVVLEMAYQGAMVDVLAVEDESGWLPVEPGDRIRRGDARVLRVATADPNDIEHVERLFVLLLASGWAERTRQARIVARDQGDAVQPAPVVKDR